MLQAVEMHRHTDAKPTKKELFLPGFQLKICPFSYWIYLNFMPSFFVIKLLLNYYTIIFIEILQKTVLTILDIIYPKAIGQNAPIVNTRIDDVTSGLAGTSGF